MVIAADPPLLGEGIFGQFAGRLLLAQGVKDAGEDARGAEGVGVVIAEDPPLLGEGIFGQFAGRLLLAQGVKDAGEAAARC